MDLSRLGILSSEASSTDNEYRTILCASTGILFDYKIVEGSVHPLQLGKVEFEEENDKTGGLLLCLAKTIHHTTKYVDLDSVLLGLLHLLSLKKVGVFAYSFIKNTGSGRCTAAEMQLICT